MFEIVRHEVLTPEQHHFLQDNSIQVAQRGMAQTWLSVQQHLLRDYVAICAEIESETLPEDLTPEEVVVWYEMSRREQEHLNGAHATISAETYFAFGVDVTGAPDVANLILTRVDHKTGSELSGAGTSVGFIGNIDYEDAQPREGLYRGPRDFNPDDLRFAERQVRAQHAVGLQYTKFNQPEAVRWVFE